MPKGQTSELKGFESLDRMTAVAALAKKIARVVAPYDVTVANAALYAAVRPEPGPILATHETADVVRAQG